MADWEKQRITIKPDGTKVHPNGNIVGGSHKKALSSEQARDSHERIFGKFKPSWAKNE